MKKDISGKELNNIFHNAIKTAIRENKALGLTSTYVKNGELVKEKPNGKLISLGRKPHFGMIKVETKSFKIKKK